MCEMRSILCQIGGIYSKHCVLRWSAGCCTGGGR